MDLLLPFIIAVLLLVAIPGPNVGLIVAQSLASGWRAGIVTVLGTTLGVGIQLIVLALGMASLIELISGALFYIKWLGVLVLLYFAYQAFPFLERDAVTKQDNGAGVEGVSGGVLSGHGALVSSEAGLNKSASPVDQSKNKKRKNNWQHNQATSQSSAFFAGVVVAIVNPKTFLFNSAFLPQFVSPVSAYPVEEQLFLLSAVYLIVLALGDSCWVLFAGALRKILDKYQRAMGIFRSFCFAASALVLASLKR